MNADVAYLGLVELGRQIHTRKLSSLDATRAMLARIDALDPTLHAYARVTAERALEAATQADAEIAAGRDRGPMHGVPIAVKDLCDTSGVVTAAGTTIHRDRVPAKDATVVARLKAAGAVLLGKLTMTEGAFSAHHPAITAPVNPWGAHLWPGVSSSGSGVATAAGLCHGSLGSDTLGSIRFPSMMNGVTGLKPTWGRVSRAGVFPLAASMDHVGPMTRSAEDAAAMLAVIAGADPDDPTASVVSVPDYLGALTDGVRGLRIGIDRELLAAHAEPAVAAVVDAALRVLADAGATPVSVRFPALDDIASDALRLCVAETAVTHEATHPSRKDEYGPVLAGLIEAGRAVDAPSLVKIGYHRAEFSGRVAAVFHDVDLVLMPAMARAATTLAELEGQLNDPAAGLARRRFTAPFDMSRSPTLTLPGGQTADGVPIGFQIIGAHFDEARILAAGHAFQAATDWHRRRPPV
ncbi:MAG: amidase [Burkholderiaceae bacterium]